MTGSRPADYAATEACLAALPQIAQAAVVSWGDADHCLVAYVVTEPDCVINSAGLHRNLCARLPEAMVPDLYVVLDDLPRAGNGSLDRQGLARAVRGGSGNSAPRVLSGPAADVADIWREVFGLESVCLGADLFDLGGHSLTITRIATRIRSRMGIGIPLTVFYDTPTILGIASAVERAARRGSLA